MVAKLRATQTLDAIIGDQRLAKFVRALLNQAWADVLTLTLLRQGGGSDQWRTQVEATPRIVAACCNEDTPADPALTTHVAEALGQVGYHADDGRAIGKEAWRESGGQDE